MKMELELENKLTWQARNYATRTAASGRVPTIYSALSSLNLAWVYFIFICSMEYVIWKRVCYVFADPRERTLVCQTRVVCSRSYPSSTVSYIMRISTKLSHPFAHFTFFFFHFFLILTALAPTRQSRVILFINKLRI